MSQQSNDRDDLNNDPYLSAPAPINTLAPRAADGLAMYAPVESALGPVGLGDESEGGHTGLSIAAVLRYKWTMVVTFLLLTAISVPAIWLFVKPFYSTSAAIRIAPIVPRIIFDTEDNGVMPLYHSFVSTQLTVLTSPELLRRVTENPQVRATHWANADPGYFRRKESLLERLRDCMMVRRQPATEIVTVHIRADKADEAKLIADTVVDEYKKLADAVFGVAGNQKLKLLEEQEEKLEREIQGLVDTKHVISKEIGSLGPEDIRSQMAQRLQLLETQQIDVERRYALLTWELDMAKSLRDDGEGEGADGGKAGGAQAGESAPDQQSIADRRYAVDPQWRNLYSALQNANHQLDIASQSFGKLHPRIRELTANVEYAQRLLEEREQEIQAQIVVGVGGGGELMAPTWDKEQMRKRLEKEREIIRTETAEQRDKVASAGEVARELAKYEEFIDRKRNLLARVRTRIEAFEVESKAPARISVHSHALLPGNYASDRRFLLTALAILGSAMAGAALGYLRSTLNPKIFGAQDVFQSVRVPFLGQLPPLRIVEKDLTNYDPAVLEGMRMVRTSLLERVERGRDQIVLVTSSCSGVGKTTVATLLAHSLARLGKRTLLVDADLRTATLSKRLCADGNRGLTCLLDGSTKDEQVITPGPIPKLDLVGAGQNLESFDPELLANGQFSAALTRWRKKYDFILLDSPPVLPVADARILASQADGTIMVLRSSHCRRTDVTRAYADLGAAGGKLLGTVLVGVRPDEAYGYSYGYGYGHHGGASKAALTTSSPAEAISTKDA